MTESQKQLAFAILIEFQNAVNVVFQIRYAHFTIAITDDFNRVIRIRRLLEISNHVLGTFNGGDISVTFVVEVRNTQLMARLSER